MVKFSPPMYWGEQNCIQPTDIANTGYVPGDNPAAEHENYFRRQTYLCLQELQSTVNILYKAVNVMLPYVVLDSGTCGENTEYSCFADGTLRVTGEGSIEKRAFMQREDFGNLEINIGGDVGEEAFYACANVNTVTVNCRKICDRVFYGCPKIRTLNIGKDVTEIGSDILYGVLFDSGARIAYDGTIAEWNNVTKSPNWFGHISNVENGVVECTDGTVEV